MSCFITTDDQFSTHACGEEVVNKDFHAISLIKSPEETKPCECYIEHDRDQEIKLVFYKAHRDLWTVKLEQWGSVTWKPSAKVMYLNFTNRLLVVKSNQTSSTVIKNTALSEISSTLAILDVDGK